MDRPLDECLSDRSKFPPGSHRCPLDFDVEKWRRAGRESRPKRATTLCESWRYRSANGVRSEWELYEQVVTADPWSDGEPAEKLVELRRELLGSPSS